MFSIISIIVASLFLFVMVKWSLRDRNKDPVPSRLMSKDQQWIVNRLRKSDFAKFEKALWDNVCPLCEKDMEVHIYGSFSQFSDHWCTHCGFITKTEVLA